MTSVLHETAVKLAHTYKTSESSLFDVLIQMEERNEFIKMECLDMYDYLVKKLKISPSQSEYFYRVTQKGRVIPELRTAVVSGKLSISVARRICGVIEQSNATEWIEAACTLTQKQLEQLVALKHPRYRVHEGIKPIAEDLHELKVVIDSEEKAMVLRVQDLVSQKTKKAATLQDSIRAMTICYLDKWDPVKRAERSSSLRTEIKAEPGSHYIKAALKHKVHLRDGFRCTEKDSNGNRCNSSRWLDIHHLIHIAHGGDNSLGNLTTVCGSHHRMLHLRDMETLAAGVNVEPLSYICRR